MRDQLARWLGRDDVVVEQISGGASNLTYRVQTGSDDLVLRRPPEQPGAGGHDVSREWTVLRALEATDLPTPRVFAVCEDDSVIGAPFYLMERVDGVVYRTAEDAAALPHDHAAGCRDAAIDALAAIHAVDVEAVGLSTFGRPEGYLERQVRRWQRQWEQVRLDELPEVDETLSRLQQSVPGTSDTALVHGDYSVHNLLFAVEQPRVTAVLDWELSTLGDPLADLGLLLLYWGPVTKAVFSVVPAVHGNPGFGSPEDVMSRYSAATGRSLDDIGFYVALATVKLAVITAGTRRRALRTDPDRAHRLEGTIRALAAAALDSTREVAR